MDNNLLTFADISDDFSGFKNDKERIKYMSKAYKNMNLTKAFDVFYNLNLSNEIKSNRSVNIVTNITVGETYKGTVKEFSKNVLTFDIPGVKEEIIARDNFSTCMDAIENYLLNHNNQLLFEVREKKDNKYYVSVVNAYYNKWKRDIEKVIQEENGIEVHIDDLVKGGYMCHTHIKDLVELTGKDYTSSVFIPGSHIVLNIERDFERWIGENVVIIPQKFVEFHTDYKTGLVENSLVGSRKKVLQIMGMQFMYDIYNEFEQKKKLAEANENVVLEDTIFEGTVTGIINSAKKTGIFVELDGKYITGLMPIDSNKLLDYRPGDPIKVRISEFEIQEGKEPFVYNKKGSKILRCNVRPVFECVA